MVIKLSLHLKLKINVTKKGLWIDFFETGSAHMKVTGYLKDVLQAFYNPDFKLMGEIISDYTDILYGQGPYFDREESSQQLANSPTQSAPTPPSEKQNAYQKQVKEEMHEYSHGTLTNYLKYSLQYLTLSAKWVTHGPRQVLQDLIDEGEKNGATCKRFAAGPHTDAVVFMPVENGGNTSNSSVTRTVFHHRRGVVKKPTSRLQIPSVEKNNHIEGTNLSATSRELEILRLYVGDNLLTTGDAKIWNRHHGALVGHFSKSTVNESAGLMHQIIHSELDKIASRGEITAEDFALIASRTIPRLLLGQCVEELLFSDEWKTHANTMREISNHISDVIVVKPGVHGYHILADKIKEDRQTLISIAEKIIALSNKSALDLYRAKDFSIPKHKLGLIESMILENLKSSDGDIYSKEDLLGMTLLVLIVGVNTVTSAAKETLLQLVAHSNWQDKIKNELLDKIEKIRNKEIDIKLSESKPSLGDIILQLRDHRYTDPITDLNKMGQLISAVAFLHEVYRIEPPVPLVTRSIPTEFIEKGIHVKQSTGAYLPVFAINRSEKIFGKDAKKFDPNRFIQKDHLDRRNMHRVKVFGVPPHPCKGEPYARLFGLILLEELCLNYQISANDINQNENIARELGAFIRYRPDPKFNIKKIDKTFELSDLTKHIELSEDEEEDVMEDNINHVEPKSNNTQAKSPIRKIATF